MQHRTRKLVATGVVLALVAGGGAAFAASGSPAAAKAGRGGVVQAVTSYLGLTAQQLRADLQAGQTLAQIATAQHRTVGGLEQAITSAVKANLDKAVTAGKLTSTQEQTLLSRLRSRLGTLVNTPHPLVSALGAQTPALLARGIVAQVAGYLGLTAQQLETELMGGKTPAQVATEHGKTVAGLEQSITSAVKARLDKAVAAGLITSQREQTILSLLKTHLDAIVNHSFTH
jgi:hypothetical protein